MEGQKNVIRGGGAVIWAKAEDCHIFDGRGKRYLDFTSEGIFSTILGPSPEIWKAIADYGIASNGLLSAYGVETKTRRRYEDMLREFTGYESVALFSEGSVATEAFWRCCRIYSGKPNIWGGLIDPDQVGQDKPKPLTDSMHGWTLGSMIMAGKMYWPELMITPEMGGERFGKAPETTGCMIMEPYHAASAQFHRESPTMDRIRLMQKTYPNIPLCIDEIQGGFGRTGKLFAHLWYQKLRPDFVTIGKACGGGLPLSALLGPKDIMEDKRVKENAHLGSTHSGNPVMCAVGIEVINQIQKQELIGRSFGLGLRMYELIKDCGAPVHGGKGLLAGLKFRDSAEATKVVKRCRKKGLLVVDTGRKWVKVGPPFIIKEEDLEEGCEILTQAVREILYEREGK